MAISLFKREPAPLLPARAALREHLRGILALQSQRQAIVDKDAAARRDCDVANAAASQVTQLRSVIDQILADSRYAETEAPDLSEQRRALADAERHHEACAATARAAETVRRRYARDIAKINVELKARYDETARLVHAVTVEELGDLATEFREKEEALRAIHRKVFARVALADQIALAHHWGEFHGAAVFGELYVSRPAHPAYQRGSSDPWTAAQERTAEQKSLEAEAARLNHELLNEAVDAE